MLTPRHFIPVNAPANDAGGIDYSNEATDLAAQREECEQMIDRDIGGTVTEIGFTVYGVQ